MDPRRPEIRDNGVGCKTSAAILACIAGVFVAAVLIVGYIAITGLVSVADPGMAVHP